MKNKTVYEYGEYAVVVQDGKYVIKNVSTGVDEHSSSVLYEAIRYAKIFNSSLKEVLNEPAEDDWGKPTVEGQMEIDFSGRVN